MLLLPWLPLLLRSSSPCTCLLRRLACLATIAPAAGTASCVCPKPRRACTCRADGSVTAALYPSFRPRCLLVLDDAGASLTICFLADALLSAQFSCNKSSKFSCTDEFVVAALHPLLHVRRATASDAALLLLRT